MEELKVRGRVVVENEELRWEVMSYFRDLYSENSHWRPKLDDLSFDSLGDQERSFLTREFKEEEIYGELMNYRGDKAMVQMAPT